MDLDGNRQNSNFVYICTLASNSRPSLLATSFSLRPA